jgi:osmotically inducible protein OsmC
MFKSNKMKRKVNAIWNGNGANGNGLLTAQSGAFNKMPYSFKTRFENDNGELGTNPEELIAAALAGCFNMKLAFVLNEADFNPTELNTDAVLTFIDGSVTSIELSLKGKVQNLNEERFIELAEDAKNNCPISGVLNCEILLNASLG